MKKEKAATKPQIEAPPVVEGKTKEDAPVVREKPAESNEETAKIPAKKAAKDWKMVSIGCCYLPPAPAYRTAVVRLCKKTIFTNMNADEQQKILHMLEKIAKKHTTASKLYK